MPDSQTEKELLARKLRFHKLDAPKFEEYRQNSVFEPSEAKIDLAETHEVNLDKIRITEDTSPKSKRDS